MSKGAHSYKSGDAPGLFTDAFPASFSTGDTKTAVKPSRSSSSHRGRGRCAALTLEPPDLSGGPVALLVARGDAEDDCGLGGVIDVGVGQTGGRDQAGRGGSTVDPHEGQLGWTRTGGGRGLA